MLSGIITTLSALLLMVFVPINIATAIALLLVILGFNLVVNGAIPFALEQFPPNRSGLAVGLYFGAFSGGISVFSSMFNAANPLTPLLGAIVGGNALLLAGCCVWWSLAKADRL
jgi:hypothetical protein